MRSPRVERLKRLNNPLRDPPIAYARRCDIRPCDKSPKFSGPGIENRPFSMNTVIRVTYRSLGVKSFATLARRFLPRFKPREIADILIAERLLQRDRNGDVVPLRRAARFASNSTLMLDRVPALLHALSSTLRHNARSTGRASSTRCERGTTIDRLPVEKIPAYNEYVKTLAHTLLNQTDNWGSQRQVPDGVKDRRRLARVGVEVFAYVETENTVRRRKPA